MCETCRLIESQGVEPRDMLGEGVTLAAVTEHEEPIFEDSQGRHWTLARHAIYEDVVFVPYVGEVSRARISLPEEAK